MSREDELSIVRQQVSILAEREIRLFDMICKRADSGVDTSLAEDKLELLEAMMWKLHRRLTRLKAAERSV